MRSRFITSLIAALVCFVIYLWICFSYLGTGQLATARANHIAVLLKDGRVLIVGGTKSKHFYLRSEFYNSFANYSWLPTKMFFSEKEYLKSCEVFDPNLGTWKKTGALHLGNRLACVVLNSGKVFAGGGSLHPEIYDPESQTWSFAGDSIALSDLIKLPGSKALLENGITTHSSPHIIDLATGMWSELDAHHRFDGSLDNCCVQLNDGRILWCFGWTPPDGLSGCELINLYNGETININSSDTDFMMYRFTLLNDGNVLSTGGPTFSSVCKLFRVKINRWESVNQPKIQTMEHAVSLLSDGRVLVCGGRTSAGITAATESYDSLLDKWSSSGQLVTPRFGHTATTLTDGRVLVIGGTKVLGALEPGEHELNSCEMFDPKLNEWSELH